MCKWPEDEVDPVQIAMRKTMTHCTLIFVQYGREIDYNFYKLNFVSSLTE